MSRARVAVMGYASVDSSTAVDEFHGLDATSILRRPLLATTPGMGGIAHLTSAVAATGTPARAISWVGPDAAGTTWADAVDEGGASSSGVAVSGTRTPAATLIEVGTGGTICLFDPGDCYGPALTAAQTAVLEASEWVLLTVAPARMTEQLLDELPPSARLAWAVKHDDDAYSPALVERLLSRADVVSFSRGERAFVTVGGIAPEYAVREGGLVLETHGAEGVTWSIASAPRAGTRTGRIGADRVESPADTTGAGDTFIGTLVGRLAASESIIASDDALAAAVAEAVRASGDLLRRRSSGFLAGASIEENH